jgi:hypothetical protein
VIPVGSIVIRVDDLERLVALRTTRVNWDRRPPDADYGILADPRATGST